MHDVQATVLHLLGLDHRKLTFRFQGRDFRLTDVEGEVVKKLLAEGRMAEPGLTTLPENLRPKNSLPRSRGRARVGG